MYNTRTYTDDGGGGCGVRVQCVFFKRAHPVIFAFNPVRRRNAFECFEGFKKHTIVILFLQ